ncbi:MAG: hypothetical protein IJ466_12610, partial [Clostridia bacterium]|nr:hypothetical protein [Clostridia bacterium]
MADWTAMMHAPMRELKIGGKIVFGSAAELELDGSMAVELTIEEGADGALLPGDVLSAGCTLDLVNDAGQWLPGGSLLGGQELTGATLMPQLGAVSGGEILWRDMGAFQIESAVLLEGEGRLRIRGYDSAAYELGGAFTDALTYPASLETLWRHAVGQTRYIWEGSVPNGSAVIDFPPDWKENSIRTVLGWIAAAAGCFVRIGRDGSLELRPVNGGKEYAIDPAAYLKLERDSVSFGPVDALKISPAGENAGEKVYCGSAGTAIHALSVRGNPVFIAGAASIDGLAEGMLDQVEGLASASLRLEWRGDPELEIGDRIIVTDTHGSECAGVLSRQTLRFSLGFSASCACAIPEDSVSGVRRAITPEGGLNASALVGAVDGGLLSAGSVTTEKLAAGSVTAEKLAASIIDAVSIDAVTAKIESLTAKDIETDRLAAALASFTVITAGTASFDRAAVQHLVANALNLSFGVGDTVFISNLRASYAQIVNAAIGNLCIKASDGNYYSIDVDGDGRVSATRTTVSDGEISAGQTDAGRVILGTDVTAESLNTSSLLATYALVNKIDAARIDVDQLFAREAFISKLATSQIVAGKSLTIIAGEASAAQNAAESA